MRQRQAYHRFGLLQNPFADLQSDNLEEAGLLHVDAHEDKVLKALREDVLDLRREATVLLVGPLGAGKTHRLLVTRDAFVDAGATAVLHNVTVRSDWSVAALAGSLRGQLKPTGLAALFPPKWYKDLTRLAKRSARDLDPQRAGCILAAALEANAPAALLLNDMQTLEGREEAHRMLQVLYALQNAAAPGTLVMFTSYPKYAGALQGLNPAFTARLDRVSVLRGLTSDQAQLILAKRLAAHRMVEDLDPLYPFTPDAVERMARHSGGSPRELLRIAGNVLEAAASSRVFHIDADTVENAVREVAFESPVPAQASPEAALRAHAVGRPVQAPHPSAADGHGRRSVRGVPVRVSAGTSPPSRRRGPAPVRAQAPSLAPGPGRAGGFPQTQTVRQPTQPRQSGLSDGRTTQRSEGSAGGDETGPQTSPRR